MQITLVDAGIIMAALNERGRHHAYVAQWSGVREIWTLGSDILVYRLPDRSRFKVVPGGRA